MRRFTRITSLLMTIIFLFVCVMPVYAHGGFSGSRSSSFGRSSSFSSSKSYSVSRPSTPKSYTVKSTAPTKTSNKAINVTKSSKPGNVKVKVKNPVKAIKARNQAKKDAKAKAKAEAKAAPKKVKTTKTVVRHTAQPVVVHHYSYNPFSGNFWLWMWLFDRNDDEHEDKDK